eukprot:COSAG01_NODE_892_length_12895_cov_10.276446_6_plen_78_part_00
MYRRLGLLRWNCVVEPVLYYDVSLRVASSRAATAVSYSWIEDCPMYTCMYVPIEPAPREEAPLVADASGWCEAVARL